MKNNTSIISARSGHLIPKTLLLVIMIGIISRCIHLFDGFYYVLSADSYIFHHIAHSIQTGDDMVAPIFTGLHTGLSYPVGLLAKVTGLYMASCIIPLIIHILMSLLLYWFTNKYYGKLAGVASVFIWALIPQACLITAAGYLDRDGLSLLILTSGTILMYESWLKGGYWLKISPLIYTVLLYLMWVQWLWMGVLLMLVLLAVVGATTFLPRPGDYSPKVLLKIAVVAILGLMPMILLTDIFNMQSINHVLFDSRVIDIAEDTPLRVLDPMVWWSWAFASLIMGIHLCYKRRGTNEIVLISWFCLFMGMTVISNRCGVFVLPVVCIVSGITFSWLVNKFREIDPGNQLGNTWQYRALGLVTIIALVSASIWSIGGIQHTIRYAPDDDWQGAFDYIKHLTPPDAKVAVYGDYGYWVIDLGERLPSSYGQPGSNVEALAHIYSADNPEDIITQMDWLECDYLVYSSQEFKGLAFESMCNAVFPNKNYNYLENNSLIRQLLYKEIDGIEGLRVVYQSDSVVLTQKATNAPQYTATN